MIKTHDKCKYYGSKRYCPPLKEKNDIMNQSIIKDKEEYLED